MRSNEKISRSRRRMLQTVGTTIAAGVVAPRVAAAGQHAGHTAGQAGAAQAPSPASVPALPRVLDDHERATLAAIGEHIVPGSRAAGAADLVDRVLAVEPPDVLRRFRNALGAFEHEARTRHARPWIELTPQEAAALLQDAATTAPAEPPPPAWTPGQPVIRVGLPASPPPPTLRDHLEHLKDVVATAYFATEAGAKELGFTGEDVFPGLPECRS